MFGCFRVTCKLSDVMRSKNEENEAYLSEIEVWIFYPEGMEFFFLHITIFLFIAIWMIFMQTIGQAYDDMQTQNQHLLHQITERDDYNIKVFILQ
jgi:E3 ubiquitin-protein ligase BRE1